MDYVISKSSGEKVYGKSKFLALLTKTGKYFRQGEVIEVTKEEAEAFIEAKLKALEEREAELEERVKELQQAIRAKKKSKQQESNEGVI